MTTDNPDGSAKPQLKVLLCSPRGFCAGVVRAIDSVEQALKRYGAPVYVRHEIVHNRYVVESLKAKGAIFVEELDEIPDTKAPVIFSAHEVRWHWVKGHAGHELNERADRLAVAAITAQRAMQR